VLQYSLRGVNHGSLLYIDTVIVRPAATFWPRSVPIILATTLWQEGSPGGYYCGACLSADSWGIREGEDMNAANCATGSGLPSAGIAERLAEFSSDYRSGWDCKSAWDVAPVIAATAPAEQTSQRPLLLRRCVQRSPRPPVANIYYQ